MKYSFVIPCYQSGHTIKAVLNELLEELKRINIDEYEIILINDCSPDNVWDIILELSSLYTCVRGISLAKNFGQHAALLAGYARCNGDIIVSLDDDGQAPINELYKLLNELEQGYDVVYAQYQKEKQNIFRRMGSRFNAFTVRIMLDAPQGIKSNSFYVARRFVIDEIIRYDNPYPYLPGLIYRSTWKIGAVTTVHRDRKTGSSGYSLHKLISLWLNGVTTFSVKPLEVGIWFGISFFVLGLVGSLSVVINKLCHPDAALGWSSLMSAILLIGGVILLMLGLIGEYIGRIYICLNKSPQYVVREDTFSKQSESEN